MTVITNIETQTTPTEHHIPEALLEKKVRITVVGCGGTGSTIACGLPYLHQAMLAWGHPYGLDVTFVDGDRISRTNCVRQPFSESEIGLYKATVLATRINLFWGLGWRGVPEFLDEDWREEQTSDWLCGLAKIPPPDDFDECLLELPLLARSRKQCGMRTICTWSARKCKKQKATPAITNRRRTLP